PRGFRFLEKVEHFPLVRFEELLHIGVCQCRLDRLWWHLRFFNGILRLKIDHQSKDDQCYDHGAANKPSFTHPFTLVLAIYFLTTDKWLLYYGPHINSSTHQHFNTYRIPSSAKLKYFWPATIK